MVTVMADDTGRPAQILAAGSGPYEEGPEDPGHYLPQSDWDELVARVAALEAEEPTEELPVWGGISPEDWRSDQLEHAELIQAVDEPAESNGEAPES